MKLIYEKEVEDDQGEDENSTKIIEVSKKDATIIHKCRHDEGMSCERVGI